MNWGAHHAAGARVERELGESLGFDPQSGVERYQHAAIDDRLDRVECRVVAVGLGSLHRVRCREGLHSGEGARVGAGYDKTGLVPGLDERLGGSRADPFFGADDELGGGCDLIDKAALQCLRR